MHARLPDPSHRRGSKRLRPPGRLWAASWLAALLSMAVGHGVAGAHWHHGHGDGAHHWHHSHGHDGHAHDGHAHDGHAHEGHAHDGHAHDGHAHDGHAHAPAHSCEDSPHAPCVCDPDEQHGPPGHSHDGGQLLDHDHGHGHGQDGPDTCTSHDVTLGTARVTSSGLQTPTPTRWRPTPDLGRGPGLSAGLTDARPPPPRGAVTHLRTVVLTV